jgi:uncharacterized membrane protein
MFNARGLWISLKSSLWFIPTICVLLATGMAAGLVELDARSNFGLTDKWPEFFGLSVAGSRSILATIAQSVITIAGVTFSITIVALSLAANQYTPRVLRNFMRDRGNQIVLGGMLAIFTYCIIVLRTMRGGSQPFVPTISVLVALALALAAVGLFIYFIHHVSATIQASSIICSICQETRQSILALFPEQAKGDQQERQLSKDEDELLANSQWPCVPSAKSGYLQSMDGEGLAALAQTFRTVIRMEHAIGDFVVESMPLVSLAPGTGIDANFARKVNRLFSIESYRTIDQDPAFGVRQIVDIAVKALSPGINDPTTATTCLDYLAAILSLLIERPIQPRCHYRDGKLWIVTRPPSFESVLDLAFNEIRQNSGKQPAVLLGLLGALEKIYAAQGRVPERERMLARHLTLVLQMAEQNVRFPSDLEAVRRKAAALQAIHERRLAA